MPELTCHFNSQAGSKKKWTVREKEMNCCYILLCRFVTGETEISVVAGKPWL